MTDREVRQAIRMVATASRMIWYTHRPEAERAEQYRVRIVGDPGEETLELWCAPEAFRQLCADHAALGYEVREISTLSQP